ncbi:MAG: EAL domain-containing protein [Parasphingorhabdus sp.]
MSGVKPLTRKISSEHGLSAGIILTFALSIFVGLSGWLLPTAWSNMLGDNLPIDRHVSAALLLNIALILLIWRRSDQLSHQKTVAVKADQRADFFALKDHATGLSNRPAIVAELNQYLADRTPLAMIALDLDHFKKVNDLYGHEAGDDLLVQIGQRLNDTCPDDAVCARLGGDEFAILLTNADASKENAMVVAENILSAFEKEFMLPEGRAKIGASIGVYASITPMCHSTDIFRRSDIAMYQAKRSLSSQIALFEPIMEAEVHQRYQMEADIRAGVPKGEFVPYYQPQYCIRGDNLLGFEVLARWNHPAGTLIEPLDFIPIAEDTGLISSLSMSVMRQALEDAVHWDHNLILAVNISPIQLNDPILDQQIMKMLIETGFPPQRLELEITESALMEDTDQVLNIITSLKSLGIKISLDDFGTGYSSMTQLKNFPFDRIKIDRSFVLSMLENEESAAIVNSIASLASSLDVPITAEGIESDEIRACLDDIGCSDGQGWLYGRPTSREELLKTMPEIALNNGKTDADAIQGLPKLPIAKARSESQKLKRSAG